MDYRICSRDLLNSLAVSQRSALLKSFLQRNKNSELIRRLNIDEYIPCTPQYATEYLNQESVKQAIHVETKILWSECSDPVWNGYNETDSRRVSTAPIYNFLVDHPHDLNILVYSGDDDAVCATIGTQKWIWNLGYGEPETMWAEYLYNNQLGGYYTTWKNTNLTFLTIHNAGHEVTSPVRFYT